MIEYAWKRYQQLKLEELESILRLRQEVFMLEQQSLYLDIDGLDGEAEHLLLTDNDQLIGYMRFRTAVYQQATVGKIERVVLAPAGRGKGLGKAIIEKALAKCHADKALSGAKLSAQCYLVEMYQDFGFEIIGEPYDDGGVMHQDMVLHW